MKSVVLAASLIAFLLTAANAEDAVQLTVSEAIRMASEKNLDLKAEKYTTAQYEAEIRKNLAIYDLVFGIQASYSDTESLSPAASGPASSIARTLTLNSSLARLIPTGATASIFFNNARTDTDSSAVLKEYWQTSLGFSLVQPLLKNFGKQSTEQAVLLSRISKQSSLERLNSQLLALVSQVRNEYFKLYSLKEELDVKKVSLQLAKKILSDTEARVKAGVMPAMEILNAQYGVSLRERELIDAEKSVSDQRDVLKKLLQFSAATDISTVDVPSGTVIDTDETVSIKKALERPDIRELKRTLEYAELQTTLYGSRLKPDLSFNASASLAGLDREYQRDLERIGGVDYPSWSIGLKFEYLIGNNAAENDYRKSRLKLDQLSMQIKSLEDAVRNDVRAAVRGVQSGYKQIEVADRGRSFAEERLKAFIRKNEVGLATTKDVLDVENDLASAKSGQIKALVSYANAVTRLWQVTGELLEKENIRIVEHEVDEIYRRSR